VDLEKFLREAGADRRQKFRRGDFRRL